MIKVLHKALNILEYVGASENGRSLGEIAAWLGEKTTTASNIVQVLFKRNYLERSPNGYKLGVSAYALTNSVRDYDRELTGAAVAPLTELSETTGSAGVLCVWRNLGRYVLFRAADKSPVTVNENFQNVSGVYTTATGMMLLAMQPCDTASEYMELHGVPQGLDAAGFAEQLREIREKGCFAREKGEIYELAVPLRGVDDGDGTGAAIGLYMPAFRTGDRDALAARLSETAKIIASETRRLINERNI